MVRRVIEEDVATPTNTTVVEDDGSWIGRTIVTLVVLALLVAGAVWLVRALSDNNDGGGVDVDAPRIENNVDPDGSNDGGTDGGTDSGSTDGTTDTTVPTSAP